MRYQILIASCLLGSAWSYRGFADEGSSIEGGFRQEVEDSTGLLLRVPVDGSGNEVLDRAELRVHKGQPLSPADDVQSAWKEGVDASSAPQLDVPSEDRWGFNRWYYPIGYWPSNYYWNNYYLSYRPYFYNYGSYFNYRYPYFWNIGGNYGLYNNYHYYWWNRYL